VLIAERVGASIGQGAAVLTGDIGYERCDRREQLDPSDRRWSPAAGSPEGAGSRELDRLELL
jgi:hypothetical protein